MDHVEAARLLGMAEAEVVAVEDAPAGTIIRTFDGVSYIDVPTDRPDARGASGLMFLVAPVENYTGAFPVYAQPGADDTEATEPVAVYPAKGSADAVLAWVAGDKDRAEYALTAEKDSGKPRSGLMAELENILAQYGEAHG